MPKNFEGLPPELVAELAAVLRTNAYRRAAVLRIASEAVDRMWDRDEAVRGALDEIAKDDAALEARMAARLKEAMAEHGPPAGP